MVSSCAAGILDCALQGTRDDAKEACEIFERIPRALRNHHTYASAIRLHTILAAGGQTTRLLSEAKEHNVAPDADMIAASMEAQVLGRHDGPLRPARLSRGALRPYAGSPSWNVCVACAEGTRFGARQRRGSAGLSCVAMFDAHLPSSSQMTVALPKEGGSPGESPAGAARRAGGGAVGGGGGGAGRRMSKAERRKAKRRSERAGDSGPEEDGARACEGGGLLEADVDEQNGGSEAAEGGRGGGCGSSGGGENEKARAGAPVRAAEVDLPVEVDLADVCAMGGAGAEDVESDEEVAGPAPLREVDIDWGAAAGAAKEL